MEGIAVSGRGTRGLMAFLLMLFSQMTDDWLFVIAVMFKGASNQEKKAHETTAKKQQYSIISSLSVIQSMYSGASHHQRTICWWTECFRR